jgi:hypothetical protein
MSRRNNQFTGFLSAVPDAGQVLLLSLQRLLPSGR